METSKEQETIFIRKKLKSVVVCRVHTGKEKYKSPQTAPQLYLWTAGWHFESSTAVQSFGLQT